jgi:hypothetical protein
MTYENILVEREEGVGIVTLNRPDVLNAMNRKLGAELLDAVKTLEADDAIGCLVITGAGERHLGGRRHQGAGGGRQGHREEQEKLGTLGARSDPKLRQAGDRHDQRLDCVRAVLASVVDIRIGCENLVRLAAASTGDQRHLVARQPDRLAAGQGAAGRPHRWGRGGHHRLPITWSPAGSRKTMEIANMIAGNHRGAVTGVKALLLEQQAESLAGRWEAEFRYTSQVMRNAKAKDAFPEFLARKGISAG